MKTTRSKKKIASTSKRRRIKKVSSSNQYYNAKRNATKLCSCVGHQLSSDSSSEDLAVKGQSHSAIDCGKIQLPVPAFMKRWTSEDELGSTEVPMVTDESHQANLKNSKTLLDVRGIPHYENTASEPNVRANRCPAKTRSSELISLFYTIVADESFVSEPSDSEDSVTSDVQHEIEVKVHQDTSAESINENAKGNLKEARVVSSQDQAVTENVDTASESSSHSDIKIQNTNGDDSDKGTWFATGHRYEYASPTFVLQSEEVSSLTYVTEEIGYCELSPPVANNRADATVSIGYKAFTQQLYNEEQLEEYTNYDYQEEKNKVFQNEASLYVIEEVPEDDCDVTSNISVETVKDLNPPCHATVGIGDTALDGLETQLDMSLVDSKDIPDPAPSDDVIEPCEEAIVPKDSTEICESATVDYPMDEILINGKQTRPVRLLNNAIINPQEGGMVFSQDQSLTEIIATGSRMVDDVKELISELLDVCMQSRGDDVAPVAAHGDFPEASTFSPATLAKNNDTIKTQNDDTGENTGVSAKFSLVTQTDYTEAHDEDPGDNVHGANRSEVCELAGTDLSPSDKLDVPDDHFKNHNQPLPLEAHINETIYRSGNIHCAETWSSSFEPQQKTQQEKAIKYTRSNAAIKSTDNDGDDENPTKLPMSQNLHESETDEAADESPIFIAENAPHDLGGMLHCTDEMWPVKKIEGYDLTDIKPIQEISNDIFDQESTKILKIIGVDIKPESITEEALLKNIASEEEDPQVDVPTLVGNQIVKIVGIDVDSSNLHVDGIKNFAPEEGGVDKVGQPLVENQILQIGVDVESQNVHVDEMGMHEIKIIGVDLETQLSVSVASDSSANDVEVDEEGDSTRNNDMMSPCVNDVGNVALESEVLTKPLLMENQCKEIHNTSKDVARCDGDAILSSDGSVSDETINKESGENGITRAERLGADTCDVYSGYICVADEASGEATGYDTTQIEMHLPTFPRRARNQENDSPSDCGSLINDGSNVSTGSPCLSHSSFEIIGHEYLQEEMEDGLAMVPYCPTIIVPPPQEEYNEEFIPPEFEADDIIVNIATVSAMGDVAPAPWRSGVSPIEPSPDPVQFRDVNSRSPSPLPRTDLDVLDCLFDICENRLQRFPVKIPHLGTETYVNPKSNPLKLSPDCLDEQGDNIQNLENQKSFAMCDDFFGTLRGDDLGFFCCDPASSESYCSLPSTDAVPERPLLTEEDSSESFLSFDTFGDVIETEQKTITRPGTVPEPGLHINLVDQVLFYDSVHPNKESDVSHQIVEGTFISLVTKEPPDDNQDHFDNTLGTLDASLGGVKHEEADDKFVFFLALFTFSLFIYCKYGTRVIEAIMRWIWICQLIIQLIADF